MFAWFKSLGGGRKKNPGWLDVSSQPIVINENGAEIKLDKSSSAEQVSVHAPPPESRGHRRTQSHGIPKALLETDDLTFITAAAQVKGRHRRNRSEGNHAVKAWKNAERQAVGLEDFGLLKVLGRGGFGKVMLVQKKDTEKLYALKVLKKFDLIRRNQVEATKTEFNILHQIRHPFLTALHFAWQSDDKLYLCMDYLPGGELFYLRQQKGRFSLQQVHLYVAEITLALGALHAEGYIYRDLKLENLLLDAQGHVCVTDFGLATRRERTGTFCGTPEYVSPEMIQGPSYTRAVDWWALGTLTYEMLVGAPPFFSRTQAVMFQKIVDGQLVFPERVPQSVRRIIQDLLQRNPLQRLGGGPEDALEVQRHAFFSGLDWEAVLLKQYPAVFLPCASGDEQRTDNFDPVFTQLPAIDSYCSADVGTEHESTSKALEAFEGSFSYCRETIDCRETIAAI